MINFIFEITKEYLAIIIAGCALATTALLGWQNHRHNRLSVRPFLVQTFRIREQKDKRLQFELVIANRGVGPAIVKGFALICDGKDESYNDFYTYDAFIRKLFKDYEIENIEFIHVNSVLEAGAIKTLLKFKYNPKIHSTDNIKRINLWVKYYSIYGGKPLHCNTINNPQHTGKKSSAIFE